MPLLTPTGSLADQLRGAISACRACVFVATRRSILSRWCMAEVGAFWGAAKKIFLFLGEPDLGDGELSVRVRRGRCFCKTEPIASGSPMAGELGIHVVADAIAEVVADDAYAIEANDQWIGVAVG